MYFRTSHGGSHFPRGKKCSSCSTRIALSVSTTEPELPGRQSSNVAVGFALPTTQKTPALVCIVWPPWSKVQTFSNIISLPLCEIVIKVQPEEATALRRQSR